MEPHGCHSAKLRSIYPPICSNIFKAAKTGNVNLIKYCVDDLGEPFNVRDRFFDRTLAHLAALNGHLNVVKWCVNTHQNYFLDSVDGLNDTLLIAAARGGNVEMVDYVADKRGALLERTSGANRTALHVAAAWGHKEIVASLVDRWNMAPNRVTADEHYTAAHLAAKSSHIPVLTWLLEKDVGLAHGVGRCDYDLLYWTVHNRLRNATRDLCRKYRVPYRNNCHGDYPIHVAFRMGSFRTAEILSTECGADMLEKRAVAPRDTVAHEAARFGHVEALKLLDWLNQTYNHLKNDLGQTPIMLAVEYSHFSVVRYLADKGAPLHFKDEKGDTLLHYTACMPYLSILKGLWRKGGSMVALLNEKNKVGETSLYKAAECENLRFVEYLVERGADLNIPTFQFQTPLSVAVERDNVRMVEYMIKKGVVSEVMDTHGLRPWDYAKSQEMKELRRLYTTTKTTNGTSERKRNCTLILDAAKKGDFAFMKFCIERHYPQLVNIRSAKSESLAHIAAVNGHLKLVQWLLRIDDRFLNEQDWMNNTLLHAAAQGGSVEVVDLVAGRKEPCLLEKNILGYTALHVAVAQGHEAVVVNLVKVWEMSPSYPTSTNNTAPQVAAEHKKFHLVEWLLEKNSSLADAVGRCERSLLHWTATWDNATMAELLCRKYSVESRSDCEGDFPIHIAFRNSHYAVVDVLYKACHANPLQPRWTFPNNTAAHEAAQKGDLETFDYLDSRGLTSDYVELKNNLLQTPVFKAAQGNQIDTFDFLINVKKVAVHWRDVNGNTILHMFACNTRIELFQYFEAELPYQIGLMLNETNKAGETLLYKATECDNLPLVRYLIRFLRPDTQRPAADNTTALVVAIKNHNHDTVELLAPFGYEKRPVNWIEREVWDYAKTDELKEFVQNNLLCPVVHDYIPPQVPHPFASVERERRKVDQTDYPGVETSTSFPQIESVNSTLLLVSTILRKYFGWNSENGLIVAELPLSPPQVLRGKMDPLAIEAIYMNDYFGGFDDHDDHHDIDEENDD